MCCFPLWTVTLDELLSILDSEFNVLFSVRSVMRCCLFYTDGIDVLLSSLDMVLDVFLFVLDIRFDP